jgi:hypothetical protein
MYLLSRTFRCAKRLSVSHAQIAGDTSFRSPPTTNVVGIRCRSNLPLYPPLVFPDRSGNSCEQRNREPRCSRSRFLQPFGPLRAVELFRVVINEVNVIDERLNHCFPGCSNRSQPVPERYKVSDARTSHILRASSNSLTPVEFSIHASSLEIQSRRRRYVAFADNGRRSRHLALYLVISFAIFLSEKPFSSPLILQTNFKGIK